MSILILWSSRQYDVMRLYLFLKLDVSAWYVVSSLSNNGLKVIHLAAKDIHTINTAYNTINKKMPLNLRICYPLVR